MITSPRMRWGLAVAVVAAAGLALWRSGAGRSDPGDRPAVPAERRIVAQAQIVPVDGIIEVRPLAEGRVLRVLVQPGDRVEADQLLAEIERDLESAAVAQRQADLAGAGARLALTREGVRPEDRAALAAAAEAAREEADLARDRRDRQVKLREQGFASEQSVVEAERNYAAARARAREARMRETAGRVGGRPEEIRAAREQVEGARAAVTQGRVALDRTRILAPIGGVVMTRNVNPGDIIGSNVTSPTLFRIVDPARVEVRFEVEEIMAADVRLGQPVTLVRQGSDTVVGTGKVIRIAPQVERRTIGADDARVRADSLIRPAWCSFSPVAGGYVPPINYRLEARIPLGRP
jgi:multidrug resistance efflux pump